MSEFVIYHNPKCSKSRQALAILQGKKVRIKVINYLEFPPSFKEIKEMVDKLGMRVQNIIRTQEDIYRQRYSNKKFSDEEWINILVKNPVLIQRPIIVCGDKAVIGRTPEEIVKIGLTDYQSPLRSPPA